MSIFPFVTGLVSGSDFVTGLVSGSDFELVDGVVLF
jgi:hypothetical protein